MTSRRGSFELKVRDSSNFVCDKEICAAFQLCAIAIKRNSGRRDSRGLPLCPIVKQAICGNIGIMREESGSESESQP